MAVERPDFTIALYRLGEDDPFVCRMQAASMAASIDGWERPDDFDEKLRKTLAEMVAGKREDLVLIARDAEGPVGVHWLELRPYPDGFDGADASWPFPELNGRRGAMIRNTAVAPRARRRGIARALKAEGMRCAAERGCAFVYGGVSKRNEPMLAFNRREGFIAKEPRDPESVWMLMYKPL